MKVKAGGKKKTIRERGSREEKARCGGGVGNGNRSSLFTFPHITLQPLIPETSSGLFSLVSLC